MKVESGRDGEVYLTDRNTAAKFFTSRENYFRERSAYERLTRLEITRVAGHAVPIFLHADDELLAIEMTVVMPPFLLDFASAYDKTEVPDFPEDAWTDWLERMQEVFATPRNGGYVFPPRACG